MPTNGMRAVWLTLLVAFAALNVWALASAGWDGLVTTSPRWGRSTWSPPST